MEVGKNEGINKWLKDYQKEYEEKKKHECPHCGRCPMCGRGRYEFPPYPIYPTYTGYQPWITCGSSEVRC